MKQPSQSTHEPRGDFPRPEDIGFLHVGFSPVDPRLLNGTYDFSSDLENSMLDVSSYCRHHGYTYLRAIFSPPDDRMWGFGKALAIREALQEVKLLIVFDYDVAIMDFKVPVESILAGWGFNSSHLVLAAEEPDREKNKWKRVENGVAVEHTNLNIGFMVLRSCEKVLDSLELFSKCPDIVPGCEEHRRDGYVPDQTAWNKYVLPTFLDSEVVRSPCNDSNGYKSSYGPNNDDCEGNVISHAWGQKAALAEVVRGRMMRRVYKETFSSLRSTLLHRD